MKPLTTLKPPQPRLREQRSRSDRLAALIRLAKIGRRKPPRGLKGGLTPTA